MQHRIGMSSGPGSCCSPRRVRRTSKSPTGSTPQSRSCRSGGSASSRRASLAWRSAREPAAGRVFPPELVVAVKAIACELPPRLGLPFSRLHVPDIRAEVIRRGLDPARARRLISDTTIWRVGRAPRWDAVGPPRRPALHCRGHSRRAEAPACPAPTASRRRTSGPRMCCPPAPQPRGRTSCGRDLSVPEATR